MRPLAPTIHGLLFLMTLSSPALVQGQEASPSEMAAARDLFDQGIEAARAERWEDARALFERSHRVVPRASTLLNLASAQAETGQLVRAAESYRRFIANAGPRERRFVPSAEEALADLESRLGRATITVENLVSGDEIWLDEQVIGHGSLGIALPVDPGDHVVTIARRGRPAGEARFSVAEGDAVEVVVEAEVETPIVPAETAPAENAIVARSSESDGDDSLWASPWLWIGVGLAVALAVVIPIVVVAGSSSNEPHVGTLGVGSLSFE